MNSGYEIFWPRPTISPACSRSRNNLPDKGGSLSVRLTGDWFKDAILERSVVVCRYNSKVVGYVMGTSLAANAHIAIIQAMLCAFPPPPDCYLYGPVCVAERSAAEASPARCLKNCERTLLDAPPCGRSSRPVRSRPLGPRRADRSRVAADECDKVQEGVHLERHKPTRRIVGI